MGVILGNLENACADLGEARRAVEYYEQALTIAREIGDRRGEATHLENMGIAYQHLGDLDAGLLNIEAALRIAQTVDDPAGVASKHYNLACIHALRGETSRAVAHLEVALAFNAEKYRRLAAEDKDLHGVRESREFRALLERFQGA